MIIYLIFFKSISSLRIQFLNYHVVIAGGGGWGSSTVAEYDKKLKKNSKQIEPSESVCACLLLSTGKAKKHLDNTTVHHTTLRGKSGGYVWLFGEKIKCTKSNRTGEFGDQKTKSTIKQQQRSQLSYIHPALHPALHPPLPPRPIAFQTAKCGFLFGCERTVSTTSLLPLTFLPFLPRWRRPLTSTPPHTSTSASRSSCVTACAGRYSTAEYTLQ